MRRLILAAVPLLAVGGAPSPASAEQLGTVLATAAGVIAGGVIGSAVAAGTTATIVGAAIGGGIACWWYDGPDTSGIEVLPRKTAAKTVPASSPAGGAILIAAPDLQVVATRR